MLSDEKTIDEARWKKKTGRDGICPLEDVGVFGCDW